MLPLRRLIVTTAAVVIATAGLSATPAWATPVLTVSGTTITQASSGTAVTLTGLSISGDPNDTLQATLSTDNGSVALPSHAGLTLAYRNNWSGDASITVSGSQADLDSALAAATMTGATTGSPAHIGLTALVAASGYNYLAPNQHFYRYIASSGITWQAADTAAKALSFNDQPGYLATIPSDTVNDFLTSKIQGATNVWFGARAYESNATDGTATYATEGGTTYGRVWRWTVGADESPIAGGVLAECTVRWGGSQSTPCSFSNRANYYSHWATGEPNNYNATSTAYAGEWAPVTNWSGTAGNWNDLSPNTASVSGYVVEFGGKTNTTDSSTSFSNVYTTTSTVAVVDVPSAPTVTATRGNASIALSWPVPADNGTSITGYDVSTDGGSSWTSVTPSGSGPLTYTVTGLTNGTSYGVRVRAVNSAGNGTPSTNQTITPVTVPGAPTGVGAARANAATTVSWTAPVSNGGSAITGYGVAITDGTTTVTCTPSPATNTTCTRTGLSNGTAYTATVHATNAIGNSVESASASVTPATVPGVPTGLTAVRDDTAANISWTAPATGGSPITAYTVTIGNGTTITTCTPSPATATTCAVTGLSNGTTYTVKVHATNSVGDGAETATVPVTPATVPSATIATATRADAGAHVTWTLPADGGDPITGYTLTATAGTKTATCTPTPSTARSCDFTGLINGTRYAITVHATNSVGIGLDSAPVQVTPARAPDAPRTPVVTAGDHAATIAWTAPADDGGLAITSYTVVSGVGGLSCVASTVAGCTISGLGVATSYVFSVHATNAVGDGPAASASAFSAVGLPAAPVVSGAGGPRSGTLTFAAPDSGGSPITGYELSLDGGTVWTTLTTTGAAPLTAALRGLTDGTTYSATVRARSAVGAGPASSAVTLTPASPPGTPTAVVPRVIGTRVVVTWSPPASDGGSPVTGYVVTASTGSTCSTTGATSCTFTDLPWAVPVTFSVVATNAAGASSTPRGASGNDGASGSATSPQVSVSATPSPPRGVRAVGSDRRLDISFLAPTLSGRSPLSGYEVSLDGGRRWSRVTTTASGGRLLTTITGLMDGATVTVAIRARNASGAGAATGTVSVSLTSWFRDPLSAGSRAKLAPVPRDVNHYRGDIAMTVNAMRSWNGTPTVPLRALKGHQLQAGQAVTLSPDAIFGFDSAVLPTRGRAAVRALAKSLRYTHAITCEGYSDYGGHTAHERTLSRARALAVCRALRKDGVKVHWIVAAYGAARPVVIGGDHQHRAANRRVVVTVTR